MIISASRRTDIPAFYGRWFINRVREGFCEVVNPFNSRQISRISLLRPKVDCIVFWTRFPVSLERYLPELSDRGYPFYFLFTVVAYPKSLEPRLPELNRRVAALTRLADMIGPHRIVWRYDPIVLARGVDVRYHLDTFAHIAELIAASVRSVVISFVDMYRHLKTEAARIGMLEPSAAAVEEIATGLSQIALDHGLQIQSCAEKNQLESFGITPGACIDHELVSRIAGKDFVKGKDPSQRKLCRCLKSRDIGVYNTCLFGCRYCYATKNGARSRERFRLHDANAPELIPPLE